MRTTATALSTGLLAGTHAFQPGSEAAERSPGRATTAFPDIPRIDVHAHIAGDSSTIARYLSVRRLIRESYGADIAIWIDVASGRQPVPDLDAVRETAEGRVLCCVGDYSSHNGIGFTEEELRSFLAKGYIGCKIWAGPHTRMKNSGQLEFPYIDNPGLDAAFNALERSGIVCASIHIADPNGPWGERTEWLPDPVEFWREMMAYRARVLRHPGLTFVTAHCMWSICQDAQIDYLRHMLATCPNLNVDLAATFQYYHLVTRDNLRDFMIEWSDRILFGTDISRINNASEDASFAERYSRCFRLLDEDGMVEGGFFGLNPAQGLALPREALEKIYWRNAARIYPRVADSLSALGYNAG